MSAELNVIPSSALTEQEQADLNASIDSIIAAHKNNRQEINRLVFESVSAMTDNEGYEQELSSRKGLRRFWGEITGSNKHLQDKINSSRAAAQFAAQTTLQRLSEQNLLTFDLITAVNNKLNASMTAMEGEINQIYVALTQFFKQNRSDMIQMENRVAKLEQNVNLLNWLNSIEYQMLDGVDYSDKRILLVEDNELNREIAAEILKMTGVKIDTAGNGKEACEKVANAPENWYDLIFMDIQMPVMNGYEATAAIRAMEGARSRIPIIAMTANAFAEDVQLAKNTGMNEHVAKPLDFEKLSGVLSTWLGKQTQHI